MNDKSDTPNKQKISKKIIAWLVTFAIIAFTIFLAFFIPFSMSNGTEKFSGKEKEMAESMFDEDGHYPSYTANDPLPNLPGLKYVVTDVYKQVPEKRCGDKRQGFGTIYIVGTSERTLFGFEQNKYEQPLCVLAE